MTSTDRPTSTSTPTSHRARWFVYAGGERIPHTAMMRGTWDFDAACSCGWDSRTGGAVRRYVQSLLDDHRAEVAAEDAAPAAPEADEPVVWAGRTFGELSRDEQRRAGRAAGAALAAELTRNAEAITAILDAAEAEVEVAPGESAAESCVHPAVACSPALVACPCDCRHCSTWRADWAEKMSATLAAPAEAVEPEAERYAAEYRFRVHYWHGMSGAGYMVYRPFRTREAAQEFIDVNAMVCRLPRVELEQVACEIHGYNPCAACAFDRPGASA